VEPVIFLQKLLVRLAVIGIWNDAVNGTDGLTLSFVVGSHALGAKQWIDDVDGITLKDGSIGAVCHTGVAGDALLADH